MLNTLGLKVGISSRYQILAEGIKKERKMKIEVGKEYKNRNGDIVKVVREDKPCQTKRR